MPQSKYIKILGAKIEPLNWQKVQEKIEDLLDKPGKSQVVTVNTEFIMAAIQLPDLLLTINKAALRVADGVGLLVAAKFLSLKLSESYRVIHAIWQLKLCALAAIFYPRYIHNPIPVRISGVDLAQEIIKIAIKRNLRIFLLGGRLGIAEKTALILQTDNPDLRIAGVYAGSPKVEDEGKIIELINKHKTDILFVAYNIPQQDLWISRNLRRTSAKLAIGLGGTFDFIAGEQKRAPLWMQNHGLEWLHRLIHQPFARFRRQLTLPIFLYAILKSKLQAQSIRSVDTLLTKP